ncbi:MAG: hypothetical protein LIO99_01320 [Clostridiales bacterium]|nr:hypothetical protein [Clostridiales bacterium]
MNEFWKWLLDAIGSGIIGWVISALLGGTVGYKIGRYKSVIHQKQTAGSGSKQFQQGDNRQFLKQNNSYNQIDKNSNNSEPEVGSIVKQKQKAGACSEQTQIGRN